MLWDFFAPKEIMPLGWLKKQLQIQADGLNGHLHEIWPDVRDSAWIGGDRDSWERVPYWLDGFIPLAFLLNNSEMMNTAQKYVEAIISKQQEDGWICPCSEEDRKKYDTWAVQLISKVLTVYYQCTGEERILEVVRKTLLNYFELLKSCKIKLFDWGKYRWFETFIALNELNRHKQEKWIFELAELLFAQGIHYGSLVERWKRPLNQWSFDTHIVNLAMMLKAEAVSCDLLGLPYKRKADVLYEALNRSNGTPVDLFTGDECLSGLSPIQGTELCAVVEQMYSLELLYAYTGDAKWAEKIEKIAFNALPAALSDDMWSHQYVQMSNQIACQKFPGKPIFRTNNEEAHLFGLEPHFGCCTANFGQGWPKLALSTYMHRDDTIINVLPIPSELTTDWVSIRLDTAYPFYNTFRYSVTAAKPCLFIVRVPSFANSLSVNGQPRKTEDQTFEIQAGIDTVIEMAYEAVPHMVIRPYDLRTVECGSLVFSVPISFQTVKHEYERDHVVRKYPYCDYELIPTSFWNYGYCGESLTITRNQVDDIPFSSQHPPVTITIGVKQIAWDYEDGYETVCAKLPGTEPCSEKQEIALVPYGCAKLRMTELPLVNSSTVLPLCRRVSRCKHAYRKTGCKKAKQHP